MRGFLRFFHTAGFRFLPTLRFCSFCLLLVFLLGIDLSHRFSFQLDAVRAVNDTVTDGIGNRRVSEDFITPSFLSAWLVEHNIEDL